MAGKSSRLAILLDLDGTQFEKGLNRSLSRFRNASKQMQSAGRSLSMGLSAPLALVGASSFKVAADFELAMAKVGAVSGGGQQALAGLTDQAKSLGGSTSFSASQVSELQLELSKLGFSATDLIGDKSKGTKGMTESVLNLAKAFDKDLGETSTVVGETLRQFGLDASDTGTVTDVMAKSFATTALDLEKFGGAMGNVAPVANEFGFSLQETTAILGVMANNGIAGTDAGTKLKMALSELAKSGVPVKDTFQKLLAGGVSYTEAMETMGTRAAILGPILGNNLDDLSKLTKEYDNATGTAQTMSDAIGNTAAGSLAEMQSAVEAAQIEIGTALAPALLDLANTVRDVAAGFAALDDDTKKTIVTIAGVAAALGPSLIVAGKVTGAVGQISNSFKLMKGASDVAGTAGVSAFKKLAGVMVSPPFLAIAAAVGVAAVAFGPLIKRMNSFEYKTRTMSGATKELNKQIGNESAEARVLFADLKMAVELEHDRAGAIDALNEKYPEFLGNMDLNTASLEDIARLEKEVTNAIADRVRQQVLADAQTKRTESLANVEKALISFETAARQTGQSVDDIKKTSAAVRDVFAAIDRGEGAEIGFFNITEATKFIKSLGVAEGAANMLAIQLTRASVDTGGFFESSLSDLVTTVEDSSASYRNLRDIVGETTEAQKANNDATADAAKKDDDATKSKKKKEEATKKETKATKTLADTVQDLADTLATTTKTESVFGEQFGKRDEDRARAIKTAIDEIIGEGFTGDVDLSALKLTAEQLEAIQQILGDDFKGTADEAMAVLVERFNALHTATEKELTPLEALRSKLAELETFQRVGLIDSMDAAQQALSALETALSESLLNDPEFEVSEKFKQMTAEIERLREGLQGLGADKDNVSDVAKEFDKLGAAQQAATDLAGSAVDALFDKNQKFGEAMKQAAVNITKSLIKQALATAISNAIASAFSPASADNIVTGGAAAPAKAAANVAAATKLFSAIPAFAEGGAVLGGRGGTLALIGENPASRGEFIVPFEKMGKFMNMAGAGSSPDIQARVLGDNLELSSRRAARKFSRKTIV
jgi:hypothetical protein